MDLFKNVIQPHVKKCISTDESDNKTNNLNLAYHRLNTRQFLFPKAFDGLHAYKHLSSIEKRSVRVDIPLVKDPCLPTLNATKSFLVSGSSPILIPAPKYKDGMSGGRYKSKGEINCNGRVSKRKGSSRCSKIAKSVSRMKASETNVSEKEQPKKSCSFCGGDNCRRNRCVLLHSFGIGYVPANQLKPGDYVIHKFSQEKSYPLDLHGRQIGSKRAEDNVHDVHDLFPLANPPNDNLEAGRKMKVERYQNQLKNGPTSATTDFLDFKEDNVDQDSIFSQIVDDESLCGNDEFFVTELQALVLEYWQGG